MTSQTATPAGSSVLTQGKYSPYYPGVYDIRYYSGYYSASSTISTAAALNIDGALTQIKFKRDWLAHALIHNNYIPYKSTDGELTFDKLIAKIEATEPTADLTSIPHTSNGTINTYYAEVTVGKENDTTIKTVDFPAGYYPAFKISAALTIDDKKVPTNKILDKTTLTSDKIGDLKTELKLVNNAGVIYPNTGTLASDYFDGVSVQYLDNDHFVLNNSGTSVKVYSTLNGFVVKNQDIELNVNNLQQLKKTSGSVSQGVYYVPEAFSFSGADLSPEIITTIAYKPTGSVAANYYKDYASINVNAYNSSGSSLNVSSTQYSIASNFAVKLPKLAALNSFSFKEATATLANGSSFTGIALTGKVAAAGWVDSSEDITIFLDTNDKIQNLKSQEPASAANSTILALDTYQIKDVITLINSL